MPAQKKSKPINLLPQEEFASSTKGRILKWFLTTFRVVVILTEVIIMAAFFSRFWLDVKSADLSDKINGQQRILDSFSNFEQEFKDYQKKLRIISSLSAKETHSTDIILNITRRLPSNIYLTNFSYTNKSITVSGVSPSEVSIAQFIINLEEYEDFEEVSLNSLDISDDQSDLLNFGITILPKGGVK